MTKRKRIREADRCEKKLHESCSSFFDVAPPDLIRFVCERLQPEDALELVSVNRRCRRILVDTEFSAAYWKRHAGRDELEMIVPPEWFIDPNDAKFWKRTRFHGANRSFDTKTNAWNKISRHVTLESMYLRRLFGQPTLVLGSTHGEFIFPHAENTHRCIDCSMAGIQISAIRFKQVDSFANANCCLLRRDLLIAVGTTHASSNGDPSSSGHETNSNVTIISAAIPIERFLIAGLRWTAR